MTELVLEACRNREVEFAVRFCGISEGKRGDKEIHQPCPFCGGTDRFHFDRNARAFFCRGCALGANIISLIMKTTGKRYRETCELLAMETGITLPEMKTQAIDRKSLTALWKTEQGKMKIAMLAVWQCRFLPSTGKTDFRTADVEVLRNQAETLTENTLDEIITLVEQNSALENRREAWVVLDALAFGKEPMTELKKCRIQQTITELRCYSETDNRQERHKTIDEVEKMIADCKKNMQSKKQAV